MIPAFYAFARGFVGLLLRLIFGLRAIGTEHVPRTGPLIVACNHISNFDPPALGCALPRPVAYMAKKELFGIPVLGAVITRLGAYPVDREAGGVAALRGSLRMLKEGRCVGIFPEGGRNVHGDKAAKGGAALLAALSGAPVVPAAVVGTRSLRPRSGIRVVFGEPFTVTRNRDAAGDDLEKWATEIMSRIHQLETSLP